MEKNVTKQELDEQIKSGATAPLFAKAGAYRVSFYPFEDTLTDGEKQVYAWATDPDNEEICAPAEDIEIFAESLYSTVYHGWRWFFRTPQELKTFCALVGQV